MMFYRHLIDMFCRVLVVVLMTWSFPCWSQSKTTKYTYDALGRLTYVEDSQNGNRDYDYDKAGNRSIVATGTSSDLDNDPRAPGKPTNPSISHIADCAWRATWSAMPGATSYELAETSGVVQTVTAPPAHVSCPTGNPSGNKPKTVRACNAVGCSVPTYF